MHPRLQPYVRRLHSYLSVLVREQLEYMLGQVQQPPRILAHHVAHLRTWGCSLGTWGCSLDAWGCSLDAWGCSQ